MFIDIERRHLASGHDLESLEQHLDAPYFHRAKWDAWRAQYTVVEIVLLGVTIPHWVSLSYPKYA